MLKQVALRRLMNLAVAASVLAYAPNAAALATQSSAVSKVDSAASEAALKLAQLLYSEESQIAMVERMVDTDMALSFKSDEDFKELEAEYPGFTDAVLAELKPALVRFTKRELPSYHRRVADLFASRLSASEIADVTQFYMTPVGRKVLQGMQDNVSIKSMLDEVATDPDRPTSYSAITADHAAAVEATKKVVDKGDEAAFLELVRKPYFTRLAALGPAMRKLEQDLTNEPAPEFEAEVQAIVKATLARFTAATEAQASPEK